MNRAPALGGQRTSIMPLLIITAKISKSRDQSATFAPKHAWRFGD
jgi:hypothetical protein